MKTLGVLAIIWILYSMYKVFTGGRFEEHDLHIEIGFFSGLIGMIVLILYLIITYLP